MRIRSIPRFVRVLLTLAVVGGCGGNPFLPLQNVKVGVGANASGLGSGRVVSNTSAVPIDCLVTPLSSNGTCFVSFEDAGGGGSFTLTATPDSASVFVLWQGCSSVAGPVCTISFNAGNDTTFVAGVTFSPSPLDGVLAKVSGDSQQVRVPGGGPLVVSYRNPDGSPRVGDAILWVAEPGGFSVGASSTVDAAGLATMAIGTSGQGEFQPARVTATAAGSPLDQVSFTVFLAHQFRVVSGDSQTAAPGARLPLPITAVFEDPNCCQNGPPATFAWQVRSGGGTLDKDTTSWGAADSMSNGWVLGPAAGAQQVRVIRQLAVENLPPDTTIITAFADPGTVNPACGAGGTLHASLSVTAPETWTAAGSPHVVRGQITYTTSAPLTIDPGAVVCAEQFGYLSVLGGLYAVGAPANPIRFTAADTALGWEGIFIGGPGVLLNEISNARIEYAFQGIAAVAAVRIDSTIIRQSGISAISIQNSASTNQVFQTTVDTTSGSNAAVTLSAPGTVFVGTIRGAGGLAALSINADSVTVQDCEISGSGGIGVTLQPFQGVVVTNCNLTGNAGLAVSVLTGGAVDARSNWWGSAAGPVLGGPNGVSSGVDASSPLAAPVNLGFRPVWIRRAATAPLSRSR